MTGLNVWDPEANLHPGDNWPVGVGYALKQPGDMAILLKVSSISSPHVKAEPVYALGSKSYTRIRQPPDAETAQAPDTAMAYCLFIFSPPAYALSSSISSVDILINSPEFSDPRESRFYVQGIRS